MTRRSAAISKAKSAIPSKKNVQKKPTLIPKERETSMIDNLRKMIGLENLRKLREQGKISEKEYFKGVRERIKAIVAHINTPQLEDEAGFVLPDLNLPYVDDTIT